MEYEKAAEILKTLLDKNPLTPEEKEAVQTALGLLSLTIISKSNLKNRLHKERTKQDNKTFKW
jgi:hypothetical protein